MLTIAQALVRSSTKYPNNKHTYLDSAGGETTYTMVEIEQKTAVIAAGLQARGLRKGDTVGLVLIDPEEFILSFFACLRIGVIAVPLYPPMSMADLDAYIEKLTRICQNAQCKVMIASERVHKVLWQVVDQVPSMKTLLQVDDLTKHNQALQSPEIHPEEIAFLQYTSGSTSDPKGVMVTHASLYANCHAISTLR